MTRPFRLSVLALAIAGAAIGTAGGDDPSTSAAPAWRIEAGPATAVEGEFPVVTGRFRVVPIGGEEKAQLPLSGGACLVANLVPFGIGRAQCVTNADCNGPDIFDTGRDPGLADYVGYCAAADGSGETPACWTRPGPPERYCRRTIDGLVLGHGEFVLGPVDADPLGAGPPLPAWAVLACLAHPGHPRACGQTVSDDRQVSLSGGDER